MEKEIKITPPEGMEIDRENSTFECIKFKPIEKKRWRGDENNCINGYYINYNGGLTFFVSGPNINVNYGVFATEKQAKSALAMARITQIIANDERFGGVVTDEEWSNNNLCKYTIIKYEGKITTDICFKLYHFLAFHTAEQRDLFLEENEDLIRDYLMID